jgi:hypothetical protein
MIDQEKHLKEYFSLEIEICLSKKLFIFSLEKALSSGMQADLIW